MKQLKFTCVLIISLFSFGYSYAQTELTFYTTMGNFTAVLTDTLTPITVDSFKSRVWAKFYDGLLFHRVKKNFVIQGGDPLGNGTGGPGYTTPDEIVSSLKNVQASLAMANAGPNTDGSQFYVNLVNNSNLNGKYTVIGMVTVNFNVVQAIGNVSTDANDKPLTDVTMDSVRITKFPASVKSVSKSSDLSVYPNPSRGTFIISLPQQPSLVSITNIFGQVVYQKEASGKLHIDLLAAPGMYEVNVRNTSGEYKAKILVQ